MRGILRMIPSSYGGNYSPLTTNWINATGESNPTILNALNTFEDGLILNSFVSRLPVIYPFVGGNSTKHAFNFMNTANFQLSFYGGITHNANGYTPNGINGYARTGILPLTSTPKAGNSFGVYSRTNVNYDGADISSMDSSSSFNGNEIIIKAVDGNTYWNNFDFIVTGNGNYLANSLGLISNVRTNATTRKLFQGPILKATISSNNTSNNNNEYYLSGRGYNTGTGSVVSIRNLSFVYFANQAFTDAEMLTFSNLVQQLQTSLSRQV